MILLIGLVFAIAFSSFIGTMSMNISWLLNAPTLVIILVPMIFFLIITKDWKTFGRYIKASFKKTPGYSAGELERIAAAAKNTRKIIIASGWFGFAIGLIALFAGVGAENMAMILMRNLSVALITVLYAVVFSYFIFFPLQVWAENKIKAAEEENNIQSTL